MARTKQKGDLGQAMVMADSLKRGYEVAIPLEEGKAFLAVFSCMTLVPTFVPYKFLDF